MEIEERKKQLRGILAFIKECESDILKALKEDLRKPVFEAHATELGLIRSEITCILQNLCSWMAPRRVATPIVHQPGKSWVQYQPLGKVLIIAPWNYPIQLTLAPLANAIGAGNSAVIKPSELSPHSASLLARKLPNYVDTQIHEGGPEVTQKLLEQKWDHIFFTGSSRVGKIVLEKAAKHLTPVTLELGGKCPAIVDQNSKIKLSARRIAWGKFINAGQTCVAPDYILAHENILPELTQELQKSITDFFGKDPEKSPDYGRIINQNHVTRLAALLLGGDILLGGQHNTRTKYFAPTLLNNIKLEHALMQEEIFGPILPILPYRNLEEAILFINNRPKPLALYYFSDSKSSQDKIILETQSGGVCFNDTLSHLGISGLPFGGVGESGFGAYHGRWGFERFSHAKAVFSRNIKIDIPLRYPPYSDFALKIANWFQ